MKEKKVPWARIIEVAKEMEELEKDHQTNYKRLRALASEWVRLTKQVPKKKVDKI